MYPITRAFICTRRRFRFARSIPHTRPDVIRIRIVSSSRTTTHGYGTTGRNIPRRNKRGESQVFLIALSSQSLRRPFLLSFPKPRSPRIEHSILRSIDSSFLQNPPYLLNSLPKTFLLANKFRDFPSISHSSRATPPPPREISRSIERRIVRASSSLRRSKYYNSRRVRLTGDVYKRLLSILSIDSPFDRVVKFDVLERV